MQHPLNPDRLPPMVARATRPDQPSEQKLAVARGLLPLGPDQLILALYQLSHDPDEGVARLSRETLQGLPEEVFVNAVTKLQAAEPLDFLATVFSASRNRMDAILRNRAISDETVERVARSCIKDVADMVASNQQRLLRHPAIIEALYLNKNTRMSTVDRVVTFAIRQGLVLDGIPAFKELASAVGAEGPGQQEPGPLEPGDRTRMDALFDDISATGTGEEAEEEEESLALLGSPTGGTMDDDGIFDEFEGKRSGDSSKKDIFSEFDRDRSEGEDEQEEEYVSLSYQISSLSVSQKIRLALLGNASHRSLLINDSNKLVAMAAIKSPTINDQEVMRYSNSRSVSEDVIRYIASKREWTRSYFVKANLVNNPKTPLPTAMQFLNHLRRNDLKTLASNKNVPSALTTAAKNRLKRFQGGRR